MLAAMAAVGLSMQPEVDLVGQQVDPQEPLSAPGPAAG